MSDYRLVETTKEVGHAIRKAHPELKVFSCFTDTVGYCIAMTAWGFEGCDFPVLQAETTWRSMLSQPHIRHDEQTRFWLCIGNQEEAEQRVAYLEGQNEALRLALGRE